MSELLELRTFGGLRALHDGRERKPLPDRLSVLLAVLIAARGRTVSRSELVDLIWPDAPPSSALNQVHRYIGELRRVLEPALDKRDPGHLIERHNEGYRLRTAEVAVDLDTFDRLVAHARKSLASGDDAEGTESLIHALELATQPAFSNLAALPLGRPDFQHIEAERGAAAVLLTDAVLRATVPERAIRAVARIAMQAPLNEVLQAKYIRLLGAAGRPSEGLAHYEVIAGVLREAFGVDPGEALRAAYLEVLSPVPAPAPVPSTTASTSTGRVSNLPPANPSYVDFSGGEERFAGIVDRGVGVGTITVLCGGGGFGKTTLAVHLARLLEQRSDASSVFLDLRGFDPEREPQTPDALIAAALNQLGVEHARLATEARARALRTAVQAGPLIAVLDSARDAEQIRPLLACMSGATVIITTRTLLQTLVVREGARLVQLDRWSEESSRDLLIRRLGVSGSAAAHPALAAIARACAGLPLALSIAAARCAGLEPSKWDAIARELNDGAGPLDALAIVAGSDDVRSVFASSLRELDEHTLTLFRCGALVPEASADVHALAAVSGLDLDDARRATRVLLGRSLLRDVGNGLVGLHDLVRSYALELLGPEERTAAESRALSYVALTARQVWSLTGRPFNGTTSAPRIDETVIPPFADLTAARTWTARNIEWIDSLSRVGVVLGLRRDVVTTQLDLRPVSDRISFSESVTLFSELDPVASDLDDPGLLAEVRVSSGSYKNSLGLRDDARRDYESAITLFASIGNTAGIAKIYRNIASQATSRGEFADAVRFAAKAADFAAKSGNASLVAACGVLRLDVFSDMKQFDRVIELAPEVVRLVRESDPGELAIVLAIQAFAQYSTGDAVSALDTARESFARWSATRSAVSALQTLATVALAAATLGRVADCKDALDRWHETLDAVGPLAFDEYWYPQSAVIRQRFDTAADILARNALRSSEG